MPKVQWRWRWFRGNLYLQPAVGICMIPHAALLMFFEVLLKGNAGVRKDKTIKEENKFWIITIFKKFFRLWPRFPKVTSEFMFLIANTAKGPDIPKSAEQPRIFNILLYSLGRADHSLHKGEKLKNINFFWVIQLSSSSWDFVCLFVLWDHDRLQRRWAAWSSLCSQLWAHSSCQ